MTPTRLLAVLLLTLLAFAGRGAAAQEPTGDGPVLVVKPQFVREQFSDVDPERGDSAMFIVLKQLTVFPEWKFKNKKEEEFYWKTVRDVKKALPYAKLITNTLTETYEYIETLPNTEAREKHLKEMESAVFKQYKPALKKFTKSQANLLVKLIQRETSQSSYEILKAFLGSFRATFWQGFGRLFGVSLKGKYRPDKDRKDAIIERVCVAVEQGTL